MPLWINGDKVQIMIKCLRANCQRSFPINVFPKWTGVLRRGCDGRAVVMALYEDQKQKIVQTKEPYLSLLPLLHKEILL